MCDELNFNKSIYCSIAAVENISPRFLDPPDASDMQRKITIPISDILTLQFILEEKQAVDSNSLIDLQLFQIDLSFN